MKNPIPCIPSPKTSSCIKFSVGVRPRADAAGVSVTDRSWAVGVESPLCSPLISHDDACVK
ncbi:hypothetical protein F2Q69_00016593 [Brassica cretica]|uniref:Uncharacterized protein n=1 Tax=Brassica cretica TaxID=69181 RepID=A0A8S9R1E2_BRACR|nr:hypothetical protein F2Q69_00016593 [Brassica cretica]